MEQLGHAGRVPGWLFSRPQSRRGRLDAGLWAADGLGYLLGAFGGRYLIVVRRCGARCAGALLGLVGALALFAWLDAVRSGTLLAFALLAALIGTTANALISIYQQHGGDDSSSILFLDSALGKFGQVVGGLLGGFAIEVGGGYGLWGVMLVVTGTASLIPISRIYQQRR